MAFTLYNPSIHAPADLVDAILAPDDPLIITDVALTYGTSSEGSSASFYDGSLALGIDSGILLTSGDGAPPVGNTATGYGQSLSGTSGDSDLNAVAAAAFPGSGTTQDATILEIEFLPTAGTNGILFNLAFGSDEFPEYSDSSFVDIAGIFINGTNIALFNNEPTQPLSVIGENLTLGNFRDNQDGALPIEYDGISNTQTVATGINPGEINTLKIAIADTGDSILDSGMFLSNLQGIPVGGSGLLITKFGTDKSETLTCGDNNDFISGGEGADIIDPGAGDDFVLAGEGDDTISGGQGSNQIDGGKGTDTVIYTGNSSDWNITVENGAIKISRPDGSTTDTLANVENLQFDDTTINGLILVRGEEASEADVFIGENNTFRVADHSVAYGSPGTETVLIGDDDPVVRFDGNIERAEFPEALASYTFQVQGTEITISEGSLPIGVFKGMNQSATLAFADGSGELSLTGLSSATFNGASIGQSPAAVSSEAMTTALNAEDISKTASTYVAPDTEPEPTTETGTNHILLRANASYNVYDDATITGSEGSDTVLVNGNPNLQMDPLIERVELPGLLASYEMSIQNSTEVIIANNQQPVITFPTIGLVKSIAFADGAGNLSLTGINEAELQGTDLPSEPGAVTTKLNTFDISSTATSEQQEGLREVIVNGAMTLDASDATYWYNIDPGDFTATIDGFTEGDVLDFVDSAEVDVINENKTDGVLVISATSDVAETTNFIELTGIPTEVDNGIVSLQFFLQQFGEGAFI